MNCVFAQMIILRSSIKSNELLFFHFPKPTRERFCGNLDAEPTSANQGRLESAFNVQSVEKIITLRSLVNTDSGLLLQSLPIANHPAPAPPEMK